MRPWIVLWPGLFSGWALAMGLSVEPAGASCAPPATPGPAPTEASSRLPDSQAVEGSNDIAWVWLGTPTRRYPHGALGSPVHAGSVHVLTRSPGGAAGVVSLSLPVHRVFEDRVPRLVDLDGDGDGQLDVASVTTPQVGGVLTLHHLQPPALVPFARALDVSNHRMGALEQQLAVIVHTLGLRPTIIVPDMARQALHALRWEAPGRWHELADLKPLPGTVERLTPATGGACAWLADGRALRITLLP